MFVFFQISSARNAEKGWSNNCADC